MVYWVSRRGKEGDSGEGRLGVRTQVRTLQIPRRLLFDMKSDWTTGLLAEKKARERLLTVFRVSLSAALIIC